MVELRTDRLEFAFPEVHPKATMSVTFQRTLRIPDDGNDYPLPPGLGAFPLCHVDDYPAKVPASWIEHGGVMLPMYQAEAMWLSFETFYDDERRVNYPCALLVATGKVNAISGQPWAGRLASDPQNYVVVPDQPWLDGYAVEKGVIRQFVAMPLGEGYSVEEQVTGKAEHGGLQIMVFPMKREIYERRFPRRPPLADTGVRYRTAEMAGVCEDSMGLAPGGRMRQEIYEDPYGLSDWDTAAGSRCFVHTANSFAWRRITGRRPPTKPITARQYTKAGLPWFDYYSEKSRAVEGSGLLAGLKSVVQMGKARRESPLPENQSVNVGRVIALRTGLRPS
ncbi:MAG: hypothetical protein GX595_20500, partial [Lentisphaerae bacterium]|nr:hypothetical protein [Lentisphaerota bacterium]